MCPTVPLAETRWHYLLHLVSNFYGTLQFIIRPSNCTLTKVPTRERQRPYQFLFPLFCFVIETLHWELEEHIAYVFKHALGLWLLNGTRPTNSLPGHTLPASFRSSRTCHNTYLHQAWDEPAAMSEVFLFWTQICYFVYNSEGYCKHHMYCLGAYSVSVVCTDESITRSTEADWHM